MALAKSAAFELLRRAQERQRLAHAYLITGPAGSGKRELAFELAALVSNVPRADVSRGFDSDVHIAEPESKSRRIVIEQIRSLERELQMKSQHGRRKVAIIFDADRLNTQAANAFLKTLEEPPDNSLLLLVSSLPETLPETVLSRCIAVPLEAPGNAPSSQSETALGAILSEFAGTSTPGLAQVFGLVRKFQRLLSEARESIQAEAEEAWKKEEGLYKQSTDGEWLKEREDHYKALIESRYLQGRSRLVEMLVGWWADVLRQQHGSARLDYPDYAATTAALARKLAIRDVLGKVAHLEDLRDHLARNVQEALALEAAFLKVFTTPS